MAENVTGHTKFDQFHSMGSKIDTQELNRPENIVLNIAEAYKLDTIPLNRLEI